MSKEIEVDNLLGMAKTALIGGNNDEAISYYNRVLEVDPKLSEAWLGKGKATAWLSNLQNIRLNEAIISFNHAIATALDNERDSIIELVVQEINNVVVALYQLSREHMIQFVSLDNSWPDYILQVSQMIDGLETAKSWMPDDETTLNNIVHLCKDNIEGYSYRDEFNNEPRLCSITPDYEMFLRTSMDNAAASLKLIDSSYELPVIEKKQADNCFIVTATMGDFHHPNVTYLRIFRDDWILKKSWGEQFVRNYYRIGPKYARLIKRRIFLRRIAYFTIVKPAVIFAKLISRK